MTNLLLIPFIVKNEEEKNARKFLNTLFFFLVQFSIPDASKIPFFDIQTLRNGELISGSPETFSNILSDKDTNLPFWIQFDRNFFFLAQKFSPNNNSLFV